MLPFGTIQRFGARRLTRSLPKIDNTHFRLDSRYAGSVPEARVIKYLKLPFCFDADRLKAEVRGMREVDWRRHYQILQYEGEWTALPLRSVDGRADDVIVSPVAASFYEDTVFLAGSPYLREVLATFQCPLRAVRLMRLNAAAMIKEHTDAELYFETGEARIHVPIITHPDVEFIVDQERLRLEEGQCWYINFNLPHSVSNRSPVERIHLVIDVTVNDWLRDIFDDPSITARKEISPQHSYDRKTIGLMIDRLREMDTSTSRQMADDFEAQLTTGQTSA